MARASAAPTRKWYYLGGYFADNTTNPCYPLPQNMRDGWQTYSAEVEFQLNESYALLLRDNPRDPQCQGKLLDLSMFTENLEYEVWKGREIVVQNPQASPDLIGKRAVAGFRSSFWKEIVDEKPEKKLLPSAVAKWVDMGVGKVIGGFYQIHSQSIGLLEELETFLQDTTAQARGPASHPRKRIVMCVELPPGWHDVKRASMVAAPEVTGSAAMEDGAPPVYEWWFGDRPSQASLNGRKPRGFWKRYHPKMCARIEQAFRQNASFKEGRVAVDVDGVRYMMHHITEETRFDYRGKEGGGATFTEEYCVSTDHPCYDPVDKLTGNCFVQFAKGEPTRRRPARRVINAEEMARNAIRTGDPCSICYSEEGQMTGCAAAHVLCDGCLRTGLRIMAGDILVNTNLLCGCFSYKSKGAVIALAERADTAFQLALSSADMTANDRMEVDIEVQDCRRQFDLGEGADIPPNMYATKIRDWFNKVWMQQVTPLYHICAHPDCADIVDNWMLKTTFDTEYRGKGQITWCCPVGHRNSVLPNPAEVNQYNAILLTHPEYYIMNCSYSNVPLRRRRFCKGCVGEGILMIAEHGDACKHWPGDERQHRHAFCFACGRTWNSECSHSAGDCADPGIQQVRLNGERLEIGFVNGQEYIKWLNGERSDAPPTVFTTEPREVRGAERQRELGMENKAELLKESQKGLA